LSELRWWSGAVAVVSATIAFCAAGYGCPPAEAGTIQLTVEGEHGLQGDLVFQAAPGEANDLHIDDQSVRYIVVDSGAPLSALGGCASTGPNSAVCPGVDTATFFVTAMLGDLDDKVQVQTYGGGSLVGGEGADTLSAEPGPGAGAYGGFTIAGGVGNDTLVNQGGEVTLRGDGGDDTLRSPEFAGNTLMVGGLGADRIFPGPGFTAVSYRYRDAASPVVVEVDGDADDGAAGEGDNVYPGVGDQYELAIEGGRGDDKLFASRPRMTILGRGGKDLLIARGHYWPTRAFEGGRGNDRLIGGAGLDSLYGGPGNDFLKGGPNGDHLYGQSGHDLLLGGSGHDRVDGGPNADTFLMRDATIDVISGHSGRDRAQVDCGIDIVFTVEDLVCATPSNLTGRG